MTSILSQAEIDELLNALSSGSEPEPVEETAGEKLNVKKYDFKAANRFPKEQIRTLNIVFQTFGQILSNRLTAMLRTSCECDLLSVEEMSFNEFNNSLPTPVVLAMLRMLPMRGSQLMEISPEAAYMVINRLLGGTSAGGESSKQFTEIELALIERVTRQCVPIFEEAWKKVCSVEPVLERIETSTQFTQIVTINEPVAVVTLNVTIGEESGLITICLPHTSLEPVAKQLNTKLWYASLQDGGKIETHPERIKEKLQRTQVSLTAYFEDTPATVVDIVNLHVGDVIRLNQKMEDPVLVKIQHIPKFYARVGMSGSRYAVQVVDVIKEEE